MQSDNHLNDSTTSRSELKNQSAFMAMKLAMKEEEELDQMRKRLRKLQIDEEKRQKQRDNVIGTMDRLKKIYNETVAEREERKKARNQQQAEVAFVHQKAQEKREQIVTQLKNVRQSVQSLRRQEMLDVLEQRRRHEEFIKQYKEEEFEKRRRAKEEVQQMLNRSRERTHIFFVDKRAKQIESKQTEIESQYSKMSQVEREKMLIRLEEERLRKRLQDVTASTTVAKKQITIMQRPMLTTSITQVQSPNRNLSVVVAPTTQRSNASGAFVHHNHAHSMQTVE